LLSGDQAFSYRWGARINRSSSLKKMLIAVIACATAINHQEVIPLFDRQHRMVPNAAMVINALPAVGEEGADQAL
jgi:hypothetical protein